MQVSCNMIYESVVSLFRFRGTEIRCSVRIFSSAGHNKEHFPVEDPLWVEALF